ncbi:MAG: iron chelate uptake ABC transporter family permease subunit [Kiloniellales bacterium]|nr:iron chelate uptake ABC transporter family permease subunit [Kiloniellales bacterium]MDJ0982049.1 iron chelate uptake ABC transporter family permease subunit [Kiloniellales bacterium]
MDDFLFRAFLGGVGVALVAGPLGCFIVWRRMAYFGASLAHSALLGVALGFVLGVDPTLGIAAAAVLLALLLVVMERQRNLPSDTLLGILAHAGLALGLVVLSFFETLRVDLMGYLFGDILAVSRGDLLWIYGGGALALGVLAVIWRGLLTATLHEELAQAEGLPVVQLRLALMLTIAIVIAIAMKIVGILLIISMLIIPAATARCFARTPEQMAVLSAVAGILAVVLGLWASLQADSPAGPSIVVSATILFSLALALSRLLRRSPV